MPLNDYPAAKPGYDYYDTVNAGKTALANGELKAVSHNGPNSEFPAGSVTYHWDSGAPVASYLVEDSVGNYNLTSRKASDGLTYYEAQDTGISAKQQAANLAIMNQQQDITDFESQYNGRFPFSSDGVVVGTPSAGFEEEMQTMITFADESDRHRHPLPREHAPVVGRPRDRGQLQHDLLQGGHGHPGRVHVRRPYGRDQGGWSGHRGRAAGVHQQPDRAVQQAVRQGRQLLVGGTVQPGCRRTVLELLDLRPARCGLYRAVADPGYDPVHPGPAHRPARVRRRLDHRAGVGGRLPARAPQPESRLPG